MDKIKIRVRARNWKSSAAGITSVSWFSSARSVVKTSESDIDVLVEFEPGKTPGLAFFGMAEDLEQIFGRKVDLLTFNGVKSSRNPFRREAILSSARVVYDEG